MNFYSIQFRLSVWYSVLVIVAVGGFGAYTYLSLEHSLYEETKETLSRRILHLEEDVLPDMAGSSAEKIRRKIDDIYSPEQNDRFIRISKRDGAIIYVSGPPQDHGFDPNLIPLLLNYTNETREGLVEFRKTKHIILVGQTASIHGTDYIFEMGTSVSPIENTLHKLVATLFIGLPIIVAIAVIGGAWLIRRALYPVEVMRATAEHISFGRLRQRLPLPRSGDAIEHLAVTLNQMLDRLNQAYQQISRFSADASHELRTPLTIMRSEIEAILSEKNISAILVDRLASILEEAEHLSDIVENLFSMARLDAGEGKTRNDIFDLSELCITTLDQMRLLADDKDLVVAVNAPNPVYISGDAARLKQVVVNLLHNAIKYTMPGGSIVLSIKASEYKAVLSLKDNGIGIPIDALPHIFERFYRVNKMGPHADQGSGLGLSIVQAICQSHGGSVSAVSCEGDGTTMTVVLPLAVNPN